MERYVKQQERKNAHRSSTSTNADGGETTDGNETTDAEGGGGVVVTQAEIDKYLKEEELYDEKVTEEPDAENPDGPWLKFLVKTEISDERKRELINKKKLKEKIMAFK